MGRGIAIDPSPDFVYLMDSRRASSTLTGMREKSEGNSKS